MSIKKIDNRISIMTNLVIDFLGSVSIIIDSYYDLLLIT